MEEEFEEEFWGVRGEYVADCWGEYPDDFAQTLAAATATAQAAQPPLNPELENEGDNIVLTGASGGTPQFNRPYSKFKPFKLTIVFRTAPLRLSWKCGLASTASSGVSCILCYHASLSRAAPLEPNARFLRSGEEPFIFAWGNGSSMASTESATHPDGSIPANRGPQDYVADRRYAAGQRPGEWRIEWLG
jgi:hypothetical protein